MKITFLNRKEIDGAKWDRVIAGSAAETIYAYSWYLDAVSERWSALVVDDYRFVMPVVWKRKAGVRYVYQPLYTQQLGVFSREDVEPELIRTMLLVLYKKYRFLGMNFNVKNRVGEEGPFNVHERSNYVLDLSGDYENIGQSFSLNTRRNIKKSLEYPGTVERNLPAGELVRLKRENDVIQRTDQDYLWLTSLLETILQRGAGKLYSTSTDGIPSSAAFFAFSKTRAIYLLSASSQKGKEQRGMFRIIDAFIRDHAGRGFILDFEGSNIPSVARFFGGFGALPEIYQEVRFSRLPVSLNKLRKHGS